jgi:hypothetical protein
MQTWYNDLPVGQAPYSLLEIDVKQSALVYNLTAGYSKDSVTA